LENLFPIESGSNRIEDLLDDKIQSYVEGELPHASEMLLELIDVLTDEKEQAVEVLAPVKPVSRATCFVS
jgi:hypothetical protein